jgi:ankyrin repeat domain-containing protein 13
MLSIKLSHTHLDYIEIIKFLLSIGADPKIRDLNGWSCLDEAVCQADVVLASTLMDYLMDRKRKEIKKQEQDLIKILKLTPDFYLEMKWDFDSSIIPFISKLAPSDTFKIWKQGDRLRMDNSLVGFKNLKAKRREMSLIFNPKIPLPSKYQAPASLFTLNRGKNQYTNVLVRSLAFKLFEAKY